MAQSGGADPFRRAAPHRLPVHPLPPGHLGALERLVAEGRAIPGTGGNVADLGLPPPVGPGPALSDVLARMRDEDDR